MWAAATWLASRPLVYGRTVHLGWTTGTGGLIVVARERGGGRAFSVQRARSFPRSGCRSFSCLSTGKRWVNDTGVGVLATGDGASRRGDRRYVPGGLRSHILPGLWPEASSGVRRRDLVDRADYLRPVVAYAGHLRRNPSTDAGPETP